MQSFDDGYAEKNLVWLTIVHRSKLIYITTIVFIITYQIDNSTSFKVNIYNYHSIHYNILTNFNSKKNIKTLSEDTRVGFVLRFRISNCSCNH